MADPDTVDIVSSFESFEGAIMGTASGPFHLGSEMARALDETATIILGLVGQGITSSDSYYIMRSLYHSYVVEHSFRNYIVLAQQGDYIGPLTPQSPEFPSLVDGYMNDAHRYDALLTRSGFRRPSTPERTLTRGYNPALTIEQRTRRNFVFELVRLSLPPAFQKYITKKNGQYTWDSISNIASEALVANNLDKDDLGKMLLLVPFNVPPPYAVLPYIAQQPQHDNEEEQPQQQPQQSPPPPHPAFIPIFASAQNNGVISAARRANQDHSAMTTTTLANHNLVLIQRLSNRIEQLRAMAGENVAQNAPWSSNRSTSNKKKKKPRVIKH
jgi:hypothetical protein